MVDTHHIDILESGIRRARWKGDLVTGRVVPEKRTPDTLSYVISIVLFDCEKRLMPQQGFESQLVGGRTQSFDYSNNPGFPVWASFTDDDSKLYFSFVCKWYPANNNVIQGIGATAIYNLSTKPISRAWAARQPTARASSGKTSPPINAYTRKRAVEHTEIVLPSPGARTDINSAQLLGWLRYSG